MAALGAQSIASSYEQLLHVDADGGGNSTTHVSVKDGDNGTTFGFTIASDALMMSSTNRLEFGDTGTYIFQSADGVLDLVSDTEIEINATTIDMNGAADLSGNLTVGGDIDLEGSIDVNGTSNLDNTDIDGTFAVDGTTISLDATTSLNIDNSNTSNGITIGTATSAVPISIGHTTSETTVNDNLVVTGDIDLAGSIDVDGTANLDAVDIDGAVQIDNTVTVGVNDTGYDVKFFGATATNGYMLWDESTDDLILGTSSKLGVGTTSPDSTVDISGAGAQRLTIQSTDNDAVDIYLQRGDAGTDGNGDFSLNNDAGVFKVIGHASGADTTALTISGSGQVYIGDDANASMTKGLTINQGTADNEILAFKSNDVAHGITDLAETDTYGTISKTEATSGGLKITGYKDADGSAMGAVRIGGNLGEAADTTKGTGGYGVIRFITQIKSGGTSTSVVGSDGNLLSIDNGGTTRFIFDAEGSFHADVESTTFDHYEDAQLVRAFDLSHGKDVIASKFDEFIDYNHETLADLKLVGREEDGTPNKFLNVTKLQQLHNGAIWQQYTEMQKMKELMYDTMVEVIGKEKADQKLTDHDIQLLDNKTLLN